MIIVRACRSSDFPNVLALINAAAAADRSRRLSENAFLSAFGDVQDVDYNAAVVVVRSRQTASNSPQGGESLAGFIWWDLPRSHAVKFEGWVHPDWRRKGVGTALLTAVESEVRRDSPITLTGRAYNDIPGTERLFQLRGFDETRRFYMMSMSLTRPVPAIPTPPGIVLRSFHPAHLPALVVADNAIFDGHWEMTPRSISTWKHELIDTRPHDPSLWILAWEGDRVVGECLAHLSREAGPEDAWIASVGVRKEWRGRGLGSAVLSCGLRALQKAGYRTASLHVDGENASAIKLYRSMGLDVARTRVHFAKQVRQ